MSRRAGRKRAIDRADEAVGRTARERRMSAAAAATAERGRVSRRSVDDQDDRGSGDPARVAIAVDAEIEFPEFESLDRGRGGDAPEDDIRGIENVVGSASGSAGGRVEEPFDDRAAAEAVPVRPATPPVPAPGLSGASPPAVSSPGGQRRNPDGEALSFPRVSDPEAAGRSEVPLRRPGDTADDRGGLEPAVPVIAPVPRLPAASGPIAAEPGIEPDRLDPRVAGTGAASVPAHLPAPMPDPLRTVLPSYALPGAGGGDPAGRPTVVPLTGSLPAMAYELPVVTPVGSGLPASGWSDLAALGAAGLPADLAGLAGLGIPTADLGAIGATGTDRADGERVDPPAEVVDGAVAGGLVGDGVGASLGVRPAEGGAIASTAAGSGSQWPGLTPDSILSAAPGIAVEIPAVDIGVLPADPGPGTSAGSIAGELVVAPDGSGDYRTLAEALELAAAGALIRLRPGHYQGPIRLDRPVHLTGDGDAERVVLTAAGGDPIVTFAADGGTVAGITIGDENRRAGNPPVTVDVRAIDARLIGCRLIAGQCGLRLSEAGNTAELRQCELLAFDGAHGIEVVAVGGLTVDRCRFQGGAVGIRLRVGGSAAAIGGSVFSQQGDVSVMVNGAVDLRVRDTAFREAAVGIRVENGANPELERCRFERCGIGAQVCDQGAGRFDQVQFDACEQAGVDIRETSQPVFSQCTFTENQGFGAKVLLHAEPSFDRCEFVGTAGVGVRVVTDARPKLRRCVIRRSSPGPGIDLAEFGLGLVEDSEVTGNGIAGIRFSSGANATILGGNIHHQAPGSVGVIFTDRAEGKLIQCKIHANPGQGVKIEKGSRPTVRRSEVTGNGRDGVWVDRDGSGQIADCDITGNERYGIGVAPQGEPTVESCHIERNRGHGAWFAVGGRGVLTSCVIATNHADGVHVTAGAEPWLRLCRFTRNQGWGVIDGGRGATVDACEFVGNGAGDWRQQSWWQWLLQQLGLAGPAASS